MWIFSYFRNQLCPCDVVSRSKEEKVIFKNQNFKSLVSLCFGQKILFYSFEKLLRIQEKCVFLAEI